MPAVGFRITNCIQRPPRDLVEGFAGLPVANIADNMSRMFCVAARIRPVNSVPLLGPALTVKARPGDNLLLHKALDLAEPGDIIVVDGQGDTANSLMGELMVRWAMRRRIGGFVIDGAIRDLSTLKILPIPVYAAGVTPAGPYKEGPGEINGVVSCGGVTVHPGDIVVGDDDGVVVIAPADAPDILATSRAKMRDEEKTREEIEQDRWDRAWVDKTLAAKGCRVVD
ncbi:methyltransferase [Rhodoplanes elegans]|uniref:Putative 4-hydroxy-4-methyl-2-oxoglutarate aldolase n=1 Tax=Rhodoplanes elegans TaxID=29408 RepID=A0A327KT05_9BRAD|nr:RraA family protein [Rhodoplanes elegans]MBK5958442.1 methyltransferase [Rhodoplanes elegans]RAI41136.1 methyltransferase [Rhodoplanes elegans]